MPKEIKSRAIANGDETNPIQASVVVSKQDPTKYGLVICNPDGSAIGNPFDFLQLKTDYTPTGSEPVGTSYWDSTKDGPVVKTESGIKEIAFTDSRISLASQWTAEPVAYDTQPTYEVLEYTYGSTKLYRKVPNTYDPAQDIFYSDVGMTIVVAARALSL